MTTALEAALEYAAAGWPVLPLHTPQSTVCDCPKRADCTSPGKHPRTMKGLDDASTEKEKIERWWRMWPTANVAVDLKTAGLLDIAPDSAEWQAEFIARGLPRTASFRSGGGEGHEHHLYQRPADCPVHRLCKENAYDVLSAGYAVMPPSLHASGQQYTWLTQEALTPAPAWAVAMLRTTASRRVAQTNGTAGEHTDEPPVRLEGDDLERWHGRITTQKADGTVDRSQSLWWLACVLAQAGATRSTIIAATQERDIALGWNKYLDRKDVDERYAILADRALTSKATVQPVAPPTPKTVPSTLPRIWTGPQLAAMAFAEPRWAIPELLPAGLAILAGRPKLGKSWLALGWSLDIPRPALALRKLKVVQGESLYMALEDGPRRMQERMALMLGDLAPPVGFHVVTEWARTNEGGLEALSSWLEQHPEARLVVIDTFKRIRPIEKNSQRLYDLDYDAIAPLAELARHHNVAIVLVFHTRKMVSDDPLEMVSGTMGATGAADAVMVLRRERGQADASLFVTGRDVEEQDLALRWEKEDTLGWQLLGNAEDFRISAERAAILETIQNMPGMAPREIAETLDKRPGSVRKLLFHMVRDGEVRERDKRYYTSGNAGNASLARAREGNGNSGNVSSQNVTAPPLPMQSAVTRPVTSITTDTAVTSVTSVTAQCRKCGRGMDVHGSRDPISCRWTE